MDFVLDALIDSLKLLPFLFIAYILIEVIEYFSASKLEHSKLLTGKYSTLFAASFGLVPQCGFSVVATDLYASKKLKIGTLLAVYIATSDEAVPLLLTNPDKISSLLPLLLIKFILAIAVGYIVDAIFKNYNNKRLEESESNLISQTLTSENAKANTVGVETKSENKEEKQSPKALQNSTTKEIITPVETEKEDNLGTPLKEPEHNCKEHSYEEPNSDKECDTHDSHHKGCCGHDIDLNSKGAKAKKFLLHPLIHTLKIFAFILIVNLIMGGIVELIGTDNLIIFLSSSKAFAPLIASVIGLIPNCASSVVITELYAMGGIGFGACMAGLIVNAGIAFVVLFKQNKNVKENFAILGTMLLIGIITGYVIQLIGF